MREVPMSCFAKISPPFGARAMSGTLIPRLRSFKRFA